MLINTVYQNFAKSYKFLEALITMNQNPRNITPKVIEMFKTSKNNYGIRKIKVELKTADYIVSRRKTGRIMKQNSLVSNYTKLSKLVLTIQL